MVIAANIHMNGLLLMTGEERKEIGWRGKHNLTGMCVGLLIAASVQLQARGLRAHQREEGIIIFSSIVCRRTHPEANWRWVLSPSPYRPG
jgi:hypothetical protein